MADLLGAMRVEIVGDNSKLDKSIETSKKNTEKFGKSTAKLGASLGKLFTGIGFAIVAKKLFDLGKQAENLFKIQESAEAKLDQTLKATGFAAGLTAEELKNMASELQNVTKVGDEATIGAQSLLLTFKSIGGEVFPRALESILDVSEAMGQDLKSSTVQIGKALNDPIKGLAALSRVGIQFTKVQEDLIKGFQKSGDLASAQDIILKELESQFGGVARAAALTAEGIQVQLNNAIGDMQEAIGESIAKGWSPWREAVTGVIEKFTELIQKQNTAKDFIRDFQDGTIDTVLSMEELQITLAELQKQTEQAGRGGSQALKDQIAAVEGLIANYDHVNDRINKNAAARQLYANIETEAAEKEAARLTIAEEAEVELEILRQKSLTSSEKQVELLQAQIDKWVEFRDIEGVQTLLNSLIEERNELLREEEELVSTVFSSYENQLMNATFAHREFTEAQENSREGLESFEFGVGIAMNSIESLGQALVTEGFTFKTFGKIALTTLAEVLSGLGAQLAAAAALSFFPIFGISNPVKGGGQLAASGAAFLASGALRGVAGSFQEGGIIPGRPSSTDNMVASVASGELIANQEQKDRMLMEFLNGGGGGTTVVQAMIDKRVLFEIILNGSKSGQAQFDSRSIINR